MSKYTRKVLPATSPVSVGDTLVNIKEQQQLVEEHDSWLVTLKREIDITTSVLSAIGRLKDIEKPLKTRLKVLTASWEKLSSLQQEVKGSGTTIITEPLDNLEAHIADEDVDRILQLDDFTN